MPAIDATPNRLIPYLLAAVATLLVFPYTFYETPMTGFDPSWMIALHLATKYHSTFGPDFCFTYGPLAVLRFRYPIVLSKFAYLLSDLYFLYIAYYVFLHFFRRYFRPGPLLFMLGVLLLCMQMEIEKWYFFFLFYFLIGFLLEPRKYLYLVHALIITIICFYIKVNSGVVDSLFFAATIGYALLAGKINWKVFLGFAGAYIALLLVSAWLLHVELLSYIRGSLYLIKDYNDVMFLPLDKDFGPRALWLTILILLCFLACALLVGWKWLSRRKFRQDLDTIFIYGIIAAALFIWYKNGFVRADGHVIHFFQMTGALVLFLYIATPAPLGRKFTGPGGWLMLALCCFMIISLPRTLIANNFARFVMFSIWPHKYAEIKNYFTTLADYDDVFARYRELTSRPNAFRSFIGSHTVDVVPTEISLCYYNGLRYEPRPGLQSYSVYDAYLDSMGASKYLSGRAPDYVLYTHDAIDERFPWTDEARLKLALINRYRPVAMIDSQLILQKRALPRNMSVVREAVQHVKLGVDIPVEKGAGYLFSRFLVHYDRSGRLKSLFYQPPPLKMIITTEDNQVWYFRTFVPLLADGILLNKFVNSTREFQLLLLSDGRLTPNVKTFRIEADSAGGFAPDIEMINTWYTIEAKPGPEAMADSLAIDSIAGGVGGGRVAGRVGGGGIAGRIAGGGGADDPDQKKIRFGIETFVDLGGYIRVSGWAINQEEDNSHNTMKVFLVRTDSTAFEMATNGNAIREFPSEVRQRKDLDSCGFKAMVARSRLPPGNYRLVVAAFNRASGKSWSKDLERYIDVRHPYRLERTARYDTASKWGRDIRYNIENVGIKNEIAFISGWAVLPTAEGQTPTRIILQNDTATYTMNTDFTRRVDIMAVYNKPYLEYSGFTVALPLAGALQGKYTIGIEKEDRITKKKEWAFTDHVLIRPENNIPIRLDSLPGAGPFYGNVETQHQDDNLLTISGWALNDTTAKAGLVSILLQHDNQTFSCRAESVPRPDIVGRFRNPALLDCGFSTVVNTGAMPAGRYRIGLSIDRKGERPTGTFFDTYIEIKKAQ